MNNVRPCECVPVDVRLKQERICQRLFKAPRKLRIDAQSKRSPAVGAFGLDGNYDVFFSETSLHEGRYKGILCSSTEYAFSGREAEGVRRSIRCHRERPADLTTCVPNQEE